MNQEQEREIYEGYVAMRHNPCWRWLYKETARRRAYLAQRLRQAADWPDYCALRGRLEALDALLGQVASIAAGFREPAQGIHDAKGGDADGNDLRPADGGL